MSSCFIEQKIVVNVSFCEKKQKIKYSKGLDLFVYCNYFWLQLKVPCFIQ